MNCERCGAPLDGGRTDRRFCTGACRTDAYRDRKASQSRHDTPTQAERVLAAARSFRGITQVDFLLPNVIDGGAPITRLAARLHELDAEGHAFECLGRRDKCKVWRLVDVEGVSGPGASLPVSPSGQSADALSTGGLFDVPVGKPQVPHWRQDAA